jgi:hypothetical protein
MSRRLGKTWRVCALLALFSIQASAAVISLRMTFAASYRPETVTLTATIMNLGDEPAHDIVVEGMLGDQHMASTAYEQLDPERTCEIDLVAGPSPQPKGVHTIAVTIRYADANGYPYSDVRAVPVLTDPAAMEQTPLSCVLGDGATPLELTATVASQHPAGVDCRIRLLSPDGITLTPDAQAATLTPRGSADLATRIRAADTLVGQSRLVVAIADAIIDGLHYSTSVSRPVTIPQPRNPGPILHRVAIGVGLGAMLVWLAILGVPAARHSRFAKALSRPAAQRLVTAGILGASVGFLLWRIPPSLVLTDTIVTGGDIPAHNYLAQHLAETLFSRGRIVSWASGWWCGFPMFQFYFPLPYLGMALLSLAIPFNIAFRLVYVAGMLCLPFAAWGAGRVGRLPHPIPALLGLAATIILYDASHTMWGVNAYSTLAGMIANSISFPIMLLFVACAARDAESATFRLRTVALLALLYMSHFFTTVMGILLVASIPLLLPRGKRMPAWRTLAAEGALGTLLLAWWLAPLLAKRGYAMDFGVNWDVNLLTRMPAAYWAAAPFALYAAGVGAVRRRLAINLLTLMLVAGLVLFHVGYSLSPVFVNVRLWPFITFALLALGAVGLGLILRRAPAAPLAVGAVAIVGLTCAIPYPDNLRAWAEWNFSGMEAKPNWEVFEKLVLPLDGTPGRLGNDLHNANSSLGSSRAFEAVPFCIDKPILEGGLVNSAAGSMFAYYIQSETSRNCAGFPTIVQPTTFTPDVAFQHLRLFNVKHFIAKWTATKEAFRQSANWRLVGACRGWELFEDTAQDGALVTVLPRMPIAVVTANWKQAGLDWLYTPQALDQHVIILPPDQPSLRYPVPLDEAAYTAYLAARRAGGAGPVTGYAIPHCSNLVSVVEADDDRIRFKTAGIGLPHLVKITWYPNWQVRGAHRVFMVSPCFMLVFPEQETVELTYESTRSDNTGQALTILGLLIVGTILWKRAHPHESTAAA